MVPSLPAWFFVCFSHYTLMTVEGGFNDFLESFLWETCGKQHVLNDLPSGKSNDLMAPPSPVFLPASSPPVPMGSHRGVTPFSHHGSLPHPKWCILDGGGSQLALRRHSPPGGPACLQQPLFLPQDRPLPWADGFAQQCGEGHQIQGEIVGWRSFWVLMITRSCSNYNNKDYFTQHIWS